MRTRRHTASKTVSISGGATPSWTARLIRSASASSETSPLLRPGSGPALDRLHLDHQHPLIGGGQGRGLDLAGRNAAGEGFDQVRLGDQLANGAQVGRGRLEARGRFRPGKGQSVERAVLGREQETPLLLAPLAAG